MKYNDLEVSFSFHNPQIIRENSEIIQFYTNVDNMVSSEATVDAEVYHRLKNAGHVVYLGREKGKQYENLEIALRHASKEKTDNRGIVDVYVLGKDWLIIIEDKPNILAHTEWDRNLSPFILTSHPSREMLLPHDRKSLKSKAENGAYFYLKHIDEYWPRDRAPIKHVLSIGISMDSEDECI